MTDKEKIREEVEKRYEYWKEKESNSHSIESEIRMSECQHLLLMFDSLQEEPASEDLGDYINELSKQFPEVSFAKLSRIAVRVAKWQKEQMMAKAIDVEVKVDAGGYPYIPQMELYDYDKDIPLAKEGDKYKVVLIKEE